MSLHASLGIGAAFPANYEDLPLSSSALKSSYLSLSNVFVSNEDAFRRLILSRMDACFRRERRIDVVNIV